MTVDEYEQRFEAILARFGGSFRAPSGWASEALHFSCVFPPMVVPLPHTLTPEQREIVVRRAEKQFS